MALRLCIFNFRKLLIQPEEVQMVAEEPPEERSWVRGAQRYFPRLQEVLYAKVSPPSHDAPAKRGA